MPTLFPPELVSTSQKALNERLAFLTVLSKKPTMSERNLTAQMTRQPSVSGAETAKRKLVLTPTEGEDNTVHQVASAADSIGNSITVLPPDTTPELTLQLPTEEEEGEGLNGGEVEGEEKGGTRMQLDPEPY